MTVQTIFLLSIAHFLLEWDFHIAGIAVCSIGLFFGLVPVFYAACRGTNQNFTLLFWFFVSFRFFLDTCNRIRMVLFVVWSLIFMIYIMRYCYRRHLMKQKRENLEVMENAKDKVSHEIRNLISNSFFERKKQNLILLQSDLQNLGVTIMTLLQTTAQGIKEENKTSKKHIQAVIQLTEDFTNISYKFREKKCNKLSCSR